MAVQDTTRETSTGDEKGGSLNRAAARTFKHMVSFGLGTLSISLASFLLVPLYTRVLTPSEYGVLELVLVTGIISTRVISLEMHSGMFRQYFAHEGEEGRSLVYSTAVLSLVPFAGACALGLAAVAPGFAELILGSPAGGAALQIAFAIAFFEVVSGLPMSLLRAQERSLAYSMFAMARFSLTVACVLFLVLVAGGRLLGILSGQLLGVAAVALLLMAGSARSLRLALSPVELRHLLRFGLPLMFANLGTFVLNSSSRYFLSYFWDTAEVGVYSLGYKVAGLITVVLVTPAQLAWTPILFRVRREPYAYRLYARMLTYVSAIGAFAVLGITLVAPYVVGIMAPPVYARAVQYVLPISAAYFAYLCYPVVATGVILEGKTENTTYAMGTAAALNLVLNYLLVPRFGAMGAAVATFVCYTWAAVWIYFPARRLHPIRYEWGRVAKPILLACLLIGLGLGIDLRETALDLPWRGALLLAFPLLLWWLRFLDPDEVAALRRAARALGTRRPKLAPEKSR